MLGLSPQHSARPCDAVVVGPPGCLWISTSTTPSAGTIPRTQPRWLETCASLAISSSRQPDAASCSLPASPDVSRRQLKVGCVDLWRSARTALVNVSTCPQRAQTPTVHRLAQSIVVLFLLGPPLSPTDAPVPHLQCANTHKWRPLCLAVEVNKSPLQRYIVTL